MKKTLWIRWAGGIETRDDGYTIYHNIGFCMMRFPDGRLEKFITPNEAKKVVDRKEERDGATE